MAAPFAINHETTTSLHPRPRRARDRRPYFPGLQARREAPKVLPPPDVRVIDAATRDMPVYREWVGTLDGSENAEIRARVTGYLLKRDYQEGALVRKGDVAV